MMTIMVRNPMLAPVLVELPLAGDAGPSVSYGYNLIGTSSAQWYSVRAWAPEVTRFAPREVKRFIFDFRIGNGEFRYDLPPGTYVFKGSYGYVWAANPPTVTVGH